MRAGEAKLCEGVRGMMPPDAGRSGGEKFFYCCSSRGVLGLLLCTGTWVLTAFAHFLLAREAPFVHWHVGFYKSVMIFADRHMGVCVSWPVDLWNLSFWTAAFLHRRAILAQK